MLTTYIYDIEVFKYDWLVCFIDVNTGERFHCWNDEPLAKLQGMFTMNNLFGGFNNKHYDDYVTKAMLYGADVSTVKELNDFIIAKGCNGWDFPFLKYKPKCFNSFDLRDDLPINLSLKAIEGNLNLPIVESSVPFDIDRPLTKAEREEVLMYCFNDVEATIELYHKRKDYLQSKLKVAELKEGLSQVKALSCTNAKLAAEYLNANGKGKTLTDEREYKFPTNLNIDLIPIEVIEFFKRQYDKNIPDEEVFKSSLTIKIGNLDIVYGWGGLHAGKLNCIVEADGDDTIILNYDVASLYPSLMINNDLVSRGCDNAESFVNLVNKRLTAKHNGDKATANALKLVINSTYGAMLNRYNDLTDGLKARSVCITGQLYLTDLIVQLMNKCKTYQGLNYNTDGVMFSINKSEYPAVLEVVKAWQKQTGLELEEDKIQKYIAKDVNNFIAVFTDGTVKTKGSYVSLFKGGDFKNNSLVIVHKAIVEYFLNGIEPETTINNADNIFDFQMIAKSGSQFKKTYWLKDNEKIEVQNCNRVYATNNIDCGTLFKAKINQGKEQLFKIASLPEHCIVDNENDLTIKDIDKNFYIELAKKRIADYKGTTKQKGATKKMATKKTELTMNVYQKLTKARNMFLAANVKKSGINRFAGFDYFELKDIVPVAEKIFDELGLCMIPTIETSAEGNIFARAQIVDIDNPESLITFNCPYRQLTIISQTGKSKMNELQGLGSEITYIRRYLYQLVLDIVEADEIDATIGKPATEDVIESQEVKVVEKPKSKKPKTSEERKEIAKELTATTDAMDDVQKKAIENGLKKLREVNDKNHGGQDVEVFIHNVLQEARAGINKIQADNLLSAIKIEIERIETKAHGITDVQKASIKNGLEKLLTEQPETENYVKEVVEIVKRGEVTETEADKIISEIAEKLGVTQ